MARNITVSLDEETIQHAKILAARRNMSLSSLLRHEILRLVKENDAYLAARDQAKKRLQLGTSLGGGPLPSREELYERAKLR
jgi:hypothetical protein